MKPSVAAVETGRHYITQSRFAEAERELRGALAMDPDDPRAHSLLAICLVERRRRGEALMEAKAALALDSGYAYGHYVLAFVCYRTGKQKEADAALAEALRLQPYNADYLVLRGRIAQVRGDWTTVLEAADGSLRHDPNHTAALEMRSQALKVLGRSEEANVSALSALREDPEDARSHANLAWLRLHEGKTAEAVSLYREALRLSPNLGLAREGLLEALRARFFLYRWFLAASMALLRIPARARSLVLLLAYFSLRVTATAAQDMPGLLPLGIALSTICGAFIFFLFFSHPVLNVTLLFHPLGRLALSRQERRESYWIVLFVGVALVSIPIAALRHQPAIAGAVAATGLLGVLLVGLGSKMDTERTRFWIVAVVGTISLLLVLGMLGAAVFWEPNGLGPG